MLEARSSVQTSVAETFLLDVAMSKFEGFVKGQRQINTFLAALTVPDTNYRGHNQP